MTQTSEYTTRHGFPADRAEKRRVLLDAVESIRETVVAHADEAEALGTLAPAAVEAFKAAGLWRLKLPAELGGAEADPVTQIEVIEAMTYRDTSAGWALMIGATSIGWPGAFLPDSAVEKIFAGGRVPTAAGSGGVTGTAVEVEGGHQLTGRFLFGSGIRHADWVIAGGRIDRGEGEPPESRTFVFPIADTIVHLDSWDVAGLRGTGSYDFSAVDLFVPSDFSWDRTIMMRGEPLRGGHIFRLGMPGFTANEHAGFALGAGRRALDLVIEAARSKRRGQVPGTVADRQVFQRFVGESDLRLKAARNLAMEVFEEAWQTVSGGAMPDATLQARMRGAAVLATDTAIDIATGAFRYAGGEALQSTNLLQRCWRDVTASGQHLAASDLGYETYGAALLGLGPVETTGAAGPSRA